jgi:predicted extracellular nuclease
MACAVAACAAVVLGSSVASRAALVVNEAYGGGGNSGSTIKNDFIELFNTGASAVNLSGYKLQYASATGLYDDPATATDNTFNTFPTGSIPAGGFFLIQEAQGAGGTISLTADYTDPTPIAMSGTTGKVRLLDPTNTVLDRVSWGSTATDFEGTGPAPGTTNPTSVQRFPNGLDTNQNATDFVVGSPTPGAVNTPEPAAVGAFAIAGLISLVRRRRR